MGQNFDHYDGWQPKMRAGIINEHECMYRKHRKCRCFNLWTDLLKNQGCTYTVNVGL
jgi:hypothetical protein